MSVIDVDKRADNLTMTITAQFGASIDRVWQVWARPRKLEHWWGPPGYPATFEEHDLRPGGNATYFMSGPDGDKHHGWWRVVAAEPPRALEFEDGFADEAGIPIPDLPVTVIRVRLSTLASADTLMIVETTFPSIEAMEQLLAMGMDEGMAAAMGQIDVLLTV